MSDSAVKGNQGKRYSPKEKEEIAQFIADYNTTHKRGGMKAASDKYGVSVVTLSNWGKSSRKVKKRKVKKAAPKKATAVKKVAAPKAPASVPQEALTRMLAIRGEIEALEKEYESLKAKL